MLEVGECGGYVVGSAGESSRLKNRNMELWDCGSGELLCGICGIVSEPEILSRHLSLV